LMKPSWKAVLKRPLRLISFSFEVIWLTDFHCDDLFPKDDRHAAESGWNEDHSDRDINHSSLNGYPSTWNGTLLNRNAYQSGSNGHHSTWNEHHSGTNASRSISNCLLLDWNGDHS